MRASEMQQNRKKSIDASNDFTENKKKDNCQYGLSVIANLMEPDPLDNEPKRMKKIRVKKQAEPSPEPLFHVEKPKKKKKDKSLKRTALELPEIESGKKRPRLESNDSADSEEGSEILNPYVLSNFRISDVLKQKLKSKGIEALFPIQALTFDAIFQGKDLVGRARTGQGKTLAFVLPILESLRTSESFQSKVHAFGRSPSVLVLAPTRELAKQVHADFEFYGEALGLATVCIYGGSPYSPQQNALRRGVDVVVGTPGRIKDHLERGTLNLKTLSFRVLDEADEMLNMGFVDDVETILGHVEDINTVHTLLFSATMPDWVQKIASRFLKASKATVDLVGEEKMKASSSVRHLLLPCARTARAHLIPDVICCYSSGGRTIIFTETKNDASELASVLPTARVLHGDIAQSQREVTLSGFRSGKFLVLVATDVAARGLDIRDVQLIIQCEPPRDVETYIHRSGRTGRAGKTGISVLFYDRKKEYMIPNIEKKAGFKFERISAPNPVEIARSSLASVLDQVIGVSDRVLPFYRPAADEIMQMSGLSAADLLAKALAKIAGHTDAKQRSLLTSHDDCVTVLLQTGRNIYTLTYAFNCLRRVLSEDVVQRVNGMSLTADGMGAVFDVPTDLVEEILSVQGVTGGEHIKITLLKSLPELQARCERSSFGRRSSFGGNRGRGPHRGGAGCGGFNRSRAAGASSLGKGRR